MKYEMDLWAAEFVLGTLPEASRSAAHVRMYNDSGFQAEVLAWEGCLLTADAPLEVAPKADLWDRIEAAVDAIDKLPETRTYRKEIGRKEAGAWETLLPGVHKKQLHIDTVQGWQTFLLRMDPGAAYASHAHTAAEECFVLDGEMMIGDVHFVAGDYHIAYAGSEHPVVTTRTGFTAYIRAELEDMASH
jgi:anti-sigma factor ChrR (cupin superfamily)